MFISQRNSLSIRVLQVRYSLCKIEDPIYASASLNISRDDSLLGNKFGKKTTESSLYFQIIFG